MKEGALNILPVAVERVIEDKHGISFSYIAGLIPQEERLRFKRLLFRRTRGNIVTVLHDLEKPVLTYDKQEMKKSMYVAIFRESQALHTTVMKVCEAFSSEMYSAYSLLRYDISGDVSAREEELSKQEREFTGILNVTTAEIASRVEQIAAPLEGMNASALVVYKWYLERQKTVYNALNMFKVEDSWFKGVCWCQTAKKDNVDEAINVLRQTKKVMCSNLKEVKDHGLTPPTSFPTNDLFRPFQEIVFTYGVPSYREANPTPFTIVTFPFLFGIMFGDFAHGLVVLSLSIYICVRRKYLVESKSMLADAVDHRYLLLFMGFFSAFCGFLYNEFAAVPLYLGSSCFDKPTNRANELARSDPNCVYPVGFDPIWSASVNDLQFINSFKMKFSVIVGVTQMVMGVVLKGLNAIYYNQSIDFWCEFLPQLIFMLAFFGYMNLMIIIKWLTDWSSVGQNGPALITLLIGIPLRGGDWRPVALYGDGSVQQSVGQLILGICTYL